MFGIDFSELIIIGAVALIVIGPKDLPRVARTAGLLLGRVTRYVSDVKSEISKEMDLSELKQMKDQIQESANDLRASMQAQVQSVQTEFNEMEQTIRAPETTTTESAPEPDKTPEFEQMQHIPSPEPIQTLEAAHPEPVEAEAPEVDKNQLDLFGGSTQPSQAHRS